MDLKFKYYKYKIKYLKLKNQIAGKKPAIKRKLDKEEIKYEEKNEQHYLIHYNDKIYNYVIDKDYPFSSPIINGTITMRNYSPSMKISQTLDYYEENIPVNNNILIYCHPTKLDDTYWKLKFLKSRLSFYNIDYDLTKIKTVDINCLDEYCIKKDGFSKDFIEENKNKYRFIFVPDCNGNWWNYQEKWNNVDKLVDLIMEMNKMIVKGGILCMSKFTNCGDRANDYLTFCKETRRDSKCFNIIDYVVKKIENKRLNTIVKDPDFYSFKIDIVNDNEYKDKSHDNKSKYIELIKYI